MAEVIVTLVRDQEFEAMGLKGRFFETITGPPYNIISRHFPIKDKWLPNSSGLCELVAWIKGQLHEGKKVVVHCNGGKGRAATVCCAVLMASGHPYKWCKQTIQTTRSGTLINPIQQFYLRFVS